MCRPLPCHIASAIGLSQARMLRFRPLCPFASGSRSRAAHVQASQPLKLLPLHQKARAYQDALQRSSMPTISLILGMSIGRPMSSHREAWHVALAEDRSSRHLPSSTRSQTEVQNDSPSLLARKSSGSTRRLLKHAKHMLATLHPRRCSYTSATDQKAHEHERCKARLHANVARCDIA